MVKSLKLVDMEVMDAWLKARADFMAKHGRVTDKIESQFVSPVDFSPLK